MHINEALDSLLSLNFEVISHARIQNVFSEGVQLFITFY